MNGSLNGQSEANAQIDALDEKLISSFPGRVVRKDLVQKLKVGFSIPVFVLEYLLGKYCSSTDDEEIANGLIRVKEEIAERVVRADQGGLIKARLQRTGSMKLIDLVTARLTKGTREGSIGPGLPPRDWSWFTLMSLWCTSMSGYSLEVCGPTPKSPMINL